MRRAKLLRWNRFIASPGSRLEALMLGRLWPSLWGEFVGEGKRARVPLHPQPSSRVGMTFPDTASLLACLHLDHEVKVSETCHPWHAQLPANRLVWVWDDDGRVQTVDGDELCHPLFGESARCY